MHSYFAIPEFNWIVLFPFLAMALTGVGGLIVLLINPKSDSRAIFFVTLIGILIALGGQLGLFGNEYTMMSEMITKVNPGMIGESLILISLLVTVLLSKPYFERTGTSCPEFYPLISWAALGGMIMCSTDNLLGIFVGLELLSISLYVLAGSNKRSKFSQEAAMKYFLLGAFATGFLLYGIAFLYGATGSLNLDSFKTFMSPAHPENRPLFLLSFTFLMVGIGFKCGLVPFHQWIPDVYAGAPINVVAFMATGAKVGPFIALYNIVLSAVMFKAIAFPVCLALSILSMVIGNVMAFGQRDVKKILAYSSMVNAGYVLIYLAGLLKENADSKIFFGYFLIGYVFATLGVFVILALVAKNDQEPITVNSLRGLSKRSPGLAALLVVFVLSQIGIGPVAGFVGKLLFVFDLVRVHEGWLAIILLANSAFAAFYYLRIIKSAYSDSDDSDLSPYETCMSIKSALAICFVGVVGTVIFYSPIVNFLTAKQ
ncbi:MAG: NADH-quinone oxidoreductase subunit N [Armatimonadota bacterium]